MRGFCVIEHRGGDVGAERAGRWGSQVARAGDQVGGHEYVSGARGLYVCEHVIGYHVAERAVDAYLGALGAVGEQQLGDAREAIQGAFAPRL